MGLLDTLRQSFGRKRRDEATPTAAPLAVRGFGVEVLPVAPFSATHLDDGTLLFGPVGPDGPPRPDSILVPGREPSKIGLYLYDEGEGAYAYGSSEPGTTALVLPPGLRETLGSMHDIRLVPTRAVGWVVRTDIFELALPVGFVLRGQADGSFEFTAEPDVTFVLHGPWTGRSAVPHAKHFAPPHTDYTNVGTLAHQPEAIPWFEFGYPRDGASRRQRFYELIADPLAYTVYFLEADAPAEVATSVFEVSDEVAKGFVPVRRS